MTSPVADERFSRDEVVDDVLLELLSGVGAVHRITLAGEILLPVFQQHLLG